MKFFAVALALIMASIVYSQRIVHPTGKTHSTVKIEAGKTYRYYDSGGPNDDYVGGESSLLTFVPAEKGQFITIKVKDIELKNDSRLYIFDGNHAGSPIIGYFQSNPKNFSLTMSAGSVFTASSENNSGALTVRFSNFKYFMPEAGWEMEVSCTTSPAPPLPLTSQDCSGAIKVCSDSAITTKSVGCNYQEMPGPGFWNTILNYGNDGENQSNWYKFEVATSGTILFLIKPHTHTDFDWALWGPYSSHQCVAWTTDRPLRISSADGKNSTTGITGLSLYARDTHEDIGDGFVAPLEVKAGEHYTIMIDDWSGNNTTFDLEWTFLNGASLECAEDEEVIVDLDTVSTVETLPVIEEKCLDPIEIKGDIIDIENEPIWEIEVQVSGGLKPYSYEWYNAEGKKLSLEPNVKVNTEGNYSVIVTDDEGCEKTSMFTIEKEEPENKEPQLTAEINPEQTWVTVGYPGAFEYKIENEQGETVITGHSVNTDEVEITRLAPGTYKVSLIYKQIKQYVTFVKN